MLCNHYVIFQNSDFCLTCCCPMCTLCQEESQLNTMSKLSLSDEDAKEATLKPAEGPSEELKSQLYNEDINNIILSDLDIGQYLGYIGAQRPYKDPIEIDEITIGGSQISLTSENCQKHHLDSCSTCSNEV